MVLKIISDDRNFLILISGVLVFCLILLIGAFSVTGNVVDVSNWCNGADLNSDGVVSEIDLEIFSENYQNSGCVADDWCNGADLNSDGAVDITDFNVFSENYGKDNCFVSNLDCVPNLLYEYWSDCEVDYRFEDLLDGVERLEGRQSRIYSDKNKCVESSIETRVCSVELEVYANEIEWCGESYYGIYEKASGSLLSRIKNNKQESIPSLDVVFDKGVEENCGIDEKPLPNFDVEDYSGVWKLVILVLFLGIVIVYFLVSRNLKKEEKFVSSFKPLKQKIVSEREELFG